MEKLNLFWAFGLALIAFASSSALEFGFCEFVVPQLSNTNHSTPFRIVKGCCMGFTKVGDRCEPDCRNVNCVNGRCIGNNTCECDPGYYFYASQGKCRPICEPACISPDAACQYPNVCQCRPRYRKVNATYCEPICSFTDEEFECINGNCIAPNKCQCLDGYEAISPFQCEPICENCRNGECIAPGVCECLGDYEKNEEGACEPMCTRPCINGWCQAPDECVCYENYEKSLNPFECLEQRVMQDRQNCQRSCVNGACMANGTCKCDYGYEMYNGKCSKMCNKKCGQGKCLENQCVCPPRYRLENSTCVPICAFEDDHDCINGDCIAPNICSSREVVSTTDDVIDDIVCDESINGEMFMESEKELIFKTLVVVLSVIIILLISILITFYVLYQHIYPKQIYFVQQKEMSSNCVYYSKPQDRVPVTEFNI